MYQNLQNFFILLPTSGGKGNRSKKIDLYKRVLRIFFTAQFNKNWDHFICLETHFRKFNPHHSQGGTLVFLVQGEASPFHAAGWRTWWKGPAPATFWGRCPDTAKETGQYLVSWLHLPSCRYFPLLFWMAMYPAKNVIFAEERTDPRSWGVGRYQPLLWHLHLPCLSAALPLRTLIHSVAASANCVSSV